MPSMPVGRGREEGEEGRRLGLFLLQAWACSCCRLGPVPVAGGLCLAWGSVARKRVNGHEQEQEQEQQSSVSSSSRSSDNRSRSRRIRSRTMMTIIIQAIASIRKKGPQLWQDRQEESTQVERSSRWRNAQQAKHQLEKHKYGYSAAETAAAAQVA